MDTEQRYCFCNDAYQEWFKRPKSEIIGSRVEEVLGQDVYRQVRPHILQALQGVPDRLELYLEGENGMRYLSVTYRPHFGQQGDVLGIYVLKQDITDSKPYQMTLQNDLLTGGLTGLRNRAAYLKALHGGIARAIEWNNVSPSCFSMWIGSSTSTIPMAMRRGIKC